MKNYFQKKKEADERRKALGLYIDTNGCYRSIDKSNLVQQLPNTNKKAA